MTTLMETLWDQIKKTPDGKSILMTDTDIEYLWHCGFIDTQQVPFPQWAAFFSPFITDYKGVYQLSQKDFKLIEEFRYKGPIRDPFDFHKINEGLYTDQGFDELFELGVGLSVEASKSEVSEFMTQFKKEFRENNLIRMNAVGKTKIGQWMDEHPSPLRRLELIMEAKVSGKALDPKLFQFDSAGVDAVSAMQMSAFSMRPGSVALAQKESLGKVTQAKAKKKGLEDESAKTTPLHKLRRSPKGTRG